jgi:hypothetical protein
MSKSKTVATHAGKVDSEEPARGEQIRRINDHCRMTFTGCRIVVTAAFAELDAHTKANALHRVRTFKAFDVGNDPYHEHDMAFFDLDGEKYFWKFDYYALDLRHGSDDPSEVENTRRVLTIGLASDY